MLDMDTIKNETIGVSRPTLDASEKKGINIAFRVEPEDAAQIEAEISKTEHAGERLSLHKMARILMFEGLAARTKKLE